MLFITLLVVDLGAFKVDFENRISENRKESSNINISISSDYFLKLISIPCSVICSINWVNLEWVEFDVKIAPERHEFKSKFSKIASNYLTSSESPYNPLKTSNCSKSGVRYSEEPENAPTTCSRCTLGDQKRRKGSVFGNFRSSQGWYLNSSQIYCGKSIDLKFGTLAKWYVIRRWWNFQGDRGTRCWLMALQVSNLRVLSMIVTCLFLEIVKNLGNPRHMSSWSESSIDHKYLMKYRKCQ